MHLDGLDREDLLAVIEAQTEIAKLGMDLGAMLEFVATRVQALTGAEGAIVELAEADEMVYRAAAGIAKNQLGLRLGRNGSLSGLCLIEAAILECLDSETDPRVDREACRRVGLRSMLVAPLRYDNTSVGVLKIASARAGAFGARDKHLLTLMTDLSGAAIYKASDFKELYERATQDPLTGLGNRALFYDRLRQGLRLAARRKTGLGLITLDMDNLKPTNDRFGHQAGDAAICETARRLRHVCRQVDAVARLGGDEFGVVLLDVPDRISVEQQSKRISAEIDAPFHLGEHVLPLGASLGTAFYSEDGEDAVSLVEKADQAMYAAKRTRKAAARS